MYKNAFRFANRGNVSRSFNMPASENAAPKKPGKNIKFEAKKKLGDKPTSKKKAKVSKRRFRRRNAKFLSESKGFTKGGSALFICPNCQAECEVTDPVLITGAKDGVIIQMKQFQCSLCFKYLDAPVRKNGTVVLEKVKVSVARGIRIPKVG
jgi:hypothetical protein